MPAKKQRILVIDDDPDIHLAVKSILQKNYDVTCHNTGPAGLAALRRQPPDLVLLDVMMSTMNEGINLLYEIRQDPALKRIPVVMLTSVAKQTGLVRPEDAGTEYLPADAFLEKPIDAAKLAGQVAETLARVKTPL